MRQAMNTETDASVKPGMRRVSVKIEVEIPEATLADLAQEALQTGTDLGVLVASRYATGQLAQPITKAETPVTAAAPKAPAARRRRAARGAKAAKPMRRDYDVRDFKHLFDKAPEGMRPYSGAGRPPNWLRHLIEAELEAREKAGDE